MGPCERQRALGSGGVGWCRVVSGGAVRVAVVPGGFPFESQIRDQLICDWLLRWF